MKNLKQQLKEIISSENLSLDELKEIEPIFRENAYVCAKQFFRSFLITALLIIVWFLIQNSIISNVTVLDLSIDNKSILQLSIPLIALITCYHTNASYNLYQEIDVALKTIYTKIFPHFGNSSLVYFLDFPSFSTLENMRADLGNDKFFSNVGFYFMSVILLLLPILILIGILIALTAFYWGSWLVLLPLTFHLGIKNYF